MATMKPRDINSGTTMAARVVVIVVLILIAHDGMMALGPHIAESSDIHHASAAESSADHADSGATCGAADGYYRPPQGTDTFILPPSMVSTVFSPVASALPVAPLISQEPPLDGPTRRALLQVFLN